MMDKLREGILLIKYFCDEANVEKMPDISLTFKDGRDIYAFESLVKHTLEHSHHSNMMPPISRTGDMTINGINVNLNVSGK